MGRNIEMKVSFTLSAKKLLNEIKEVLTTMGLHLGMDVSEWPPENIEELAKKHEDQY